MRYETMPLRFASWNIHGMRRFKGQINMLRHIGDDLVALQEVTAQAYQDLVENKLFAWSA